MNKQTKSFAFALISLAISMFFAITPSGVQAQYDNYGGYTYNNTYTNYPSPLTVTTNNANFITQSSATLNGRVDGASYNTYLSTWFEYGTTPNFGSSTVRINSTGYSNFSATIGSLSPNTTYYFRALVQTAQGAIFYGSTNSFRTNYAYGYGDPNPPVPTSLTAITRPANSIGSRSVDLNALLITTYGYPSSTWFEWGTDYSLGNVTPIVSIDSLPSVKHVSTITKLEPSTTYYFRAVVVNSLSRQNGAILSFTTKYAAVSQPVEPTTPKDTVEETKVTSSDLSASAFGSNFFPKSFFEWTVMFILILILIMLARYLLRRD